MSEVKCYYCDDGKCSCIFSLGLECSGYSSSCRMRKQAEPLAKFSETLIDIAKSAYGIRPDGGGR